MGVGLQQRERAEISFSCSFLVLVLLLSHRPHQGSFGRRGVARVLSHKTKHQAADADGYWPVVTCLLCAYLPYVCMLSSPTLGWGRSRNPAPHDLTAGLRYSGGVSLHRLLLRKYILSVQTYMTKKLATAASCAVTTRVAERRRTAVQPSMRLKVLSSLLTPDRAASTVQSACLVRPKI